MRRAQSGMTLIELLIALALTAMMMGAIGALLDATSASAARTADQLDLQAQARFAARRIAQRIAQTPAAELPAKSNTASSGSWLSPALYQLDVDAATGVSRLTETVGSTTRVLAEPVTAFSLTNTAAMGTPLVKVSLTMQRADSHASAAFTTRLGSAL